MTSTLTQEDLAYLWARHPEIARDWQKYGLQITKTAIDIDPNRYPDLYRDMSEVAAVMEAQFPDMQPVRVVVGTRTYWPRFDGTLAHWGARGDEIQISPYFANMWGDQRFKNYIRYNYNIGWFSASPDPKSILSHEMGHHLTAPLMGFRGRPYDNVAIDGYNSIIAQLPPKDRAKVMSGDYRPVNQWVNKHISTYATTNQWEFATEAMNQAMWDPKAEQISYDLFQQTHDDWAYLNKHPEIIKQYNLVQPITKSQKWFFAVTDPEFNAAYNNVELPSQIVRTPGVDELIKHFNMIDNHIRDSQTAALWDGRAYNLRRVAKDTNTELDHLFYHASTYGDTGLQNSFLAGWRSVSGLGKGPDNVSPDVIPPEYLQQLDGVRQEYMKNMNDLEKFTRNDTKRFMVDARKIYSGDMEMPKNAVQRIGIKGYTRSDGSRVRLGPMGQMYTEASNQKAFNIGTLGAAQQAGIKFMEVSDGPGCGWTSHDDTDIADGKIVSVEEAHANPIAHAHCQRKFIPRPDIKKDPNKAGKLSKAAKIAALAAGTAAAGLAFRALFEVTEQIVDPELFAHFADLDRATGIFSKTFAHLVDDLQKPGQKAFYDIDRIPGFEEIPLIRGAAEGDVLPFPSDVATMAGWKNKVVDWGDAVLDHRVRVPDLPDWVKKSVHALDSDSDADIAKKFMAFSQWVHASRVNAEVADNLGRVISFEARRRQWNEWVILKGLDNSQFRSQLMWTWTKYGPRTRIDLTDFLRGRVTLTKDGIRRSITFNPSGNFRAMMGLSQDGTLIGALRLVPNRLFRAIIETDEFGRIRGNVRLVPKNWPFKAILEFGTPRPDGWQYKGLVAGKDFVDLRTAATAARGFGLHDFSFREVYGQLRQMELQNIAFQIRLFRDTPLAVSAQWKIPISQVMDSIQRMVAEGQLIRDGAGWTGIFRWNPSEALLEEFQKIVAASKTTVFGDIKFSQLTPGISKWLPEVMSRTKVYFEGTKYKQIMTSFRISSLAAVRDAKNLEIFSEILKLPSAAYHDYRNMMREIDSRIILFMRDHHILTPDRIRKYFEDNYQELIRQFGSQIGNRADIFQGTLQAVKGIADENVIDLARKQHRIIPGSQTHQKWLRILANIKPYDDKYTIERKLQDMVFFMRTMELDSPSNIELLDSITDMDIHLAAVRMAKARIERAAIPITDYLKPPLEKILKPIRESPVAQQVVGELKKNLDSLQAWLISGNKVKLPDFIKVLPDDNPLSKLWNPLVNTAKNFVDSDFQYRLQTSLGWQMERLRYFFVNDFRLPAPEIKRVEAGQGLLAQTQPLKTLHRYQNNIDETLYPTLHADVQRAASAYEQLFPELPGTTFRVGTVEDFRFYPGTLAVHIDEEGILINPIFARHWDDPELMRMMQGMAGRGQMVGNGRPISVITHELNHHIHRYVADWDDLDLSVRTRLGEMLGESGPVDRLTLQQHAWNNISKYAISDLQAIPVPGVGMRQEYYEFWAEALNDVMHNDSPDELSKFVYDRFRAIIDHVGQRPELWTNPRNLGLPLEMSLAPKEVGEAVKNNIADFAQPYFVKLLHKMEQSPTVVQAARDLDGIIREIYPLVIKRTISPIPFPTFSNVVPPTLRFRWNLFVHNFNTSIVHFAEDHLELEKFRDSVAWYLNMTSERLGQFITRAMGATTDKAVSGGLIDKLPVKPLPQYLQDLIKIDKNRYPELYADAERAQSMLDQLFPDLPGAAIKIGEWSDFKDNLTILAHYDSIDRTVRINPYVARHWADPVFQEMQARLASMGGLAGDGRNVGLLVHELGHHVDEMLGAYDPAVEGQLRAELANLFRLPVEQIDRKFLGSYLQHRISMYAPSDLKTRTLKGVERRMYEAYAELFTHAVFSDNPEYIATWMVDRWQGIASFLRENPNAWRDLRAYLFPFKLQEGKTQAVERLAVDLQQRFMPTKVFRTDEKWRTIMDPLSAANVLHDQRIKRADEYFIQILESKEVTLRPAEMDQLQYGIYRAFGLTESESRDLTGIRIWNFNNKFRKGADDLVDKYVNRQSIAKVVQDDFLAVTVNDKGYILDAYNREEINTYVQEGFDLYKQLRRDHPDMADAVDRYKSTSAELNTWMKAGSARDLSFDDQHRMVAELTRQTTRGTWPGSLREKLDLIKAGEVPEDVIAGDPVKREYFRLVKEVMDDIETSNTSRMTEIGLFRNVDNLSDAVVHKAMAEVPGEGFFYQLDKKYTLEMHLVDQAHEYMALRTKFHPQVLFRGIRDQELAVKLSEMHPGSVIQFDNFSSASLVSSRADNFTTYGPDGQRMMFAILPRDGDIPHAVALGEKNSEIEWLFDRNAKFEIVDIHDHQNLLRYIEGVPGREDYRYATNPYKVIVLREVDAAEPLRVVEKPTLSDFMPDFYKMRPEEIKVAFTDQRELRAFETVNRLRNANEIPDEDLRKVEYAVYRQYGMTKVDAERLAKVLDVEAEDAQWVQEAYDKAATYGLTEDFVQKTMQDDFVSMMRSGKTIVPTWSNAEMVMHTRENLSLFEKLERYDHQAAQALQRYKSSSQVLNTVSKNGSIRAVTDTRLEDNFMTTFDNFMVDEDLARPGGFEAEHLLYNFQRYDNVDSWMDHDAEPFQRESMRLFQTVVMQHKDVDERLALLQDPLKLAEETVQYVRGHPSSTTGIDNAVKQEILDVERARGILNHDSEFHPSVVFRGIRDRDLNDALLHTAPGAKVKFNYFASTSLSPQLANHFTEENTIFAILPKKDSIAPWAGYTDMEHEWLLPKDAEFEVVDVMRNVNYLTFRYGQVSGLQQDVLEKGYNVVILRQL